MSTRLRGVSPAVGLFSFVVGALLLAPSQVVAQDDDLELAPVPKAEEPSLAPIGGAAEEPELTPLTEQPAAAEQPAIAPSVETTAKPAGRGRRVELAPRFGFGWQSQPDTHDTATHSWAGLNVAIYPIDNLLIGLSFREQEYSRTYLTTLQAREGGLAPVVLDERSFGGGLTLGYDIAASASLVLRPMLGFGLTAFANELVPVTAMGPTGGLDIEARLSNRLTLRVGASHLYNVSVPETNDALGAPLGITTYGGDLWLGYASYFRLGLGYEGSAMPLARSLRLSHSVLFTGLFIL